MGRIGFILSLINSVILIVLVVLSIRVKVYRIYGSFPELVQLEVRNQIDNHLGFLYTKQSLEDMRYEIDSLRYEVYDNGALVGAIYDMVSGEILFSGDEIIK